MHEHLHESEFSIHSAHSDSHNQHIKQRFKVNLKGAKKDIQEQLLMHLRGSIYTHFIIVLKRRDLLYLYLIYQLTLPISHKREPTTRTTSSCPPYEKLSWIVSDLSQFSGQRPRERQSCLHRHVGRS